MYEFHGWIKLAESPSEIDEGGLDKKIENLEKVLSKFEWLNGRCEIIAMNGTHVLVLNAALNRRRSEAENLSTVIKLIVNDFKGAYGIIYEYDEQVSLSYGRGIFCVKVIKRGFCETLLDPFLSPTIPVVENY